MPADDIVVNLLKMHSTGGPLAGRPLTEVHPDLLAEYFGQRLGIQTGGTRVVVQNAQKKSLQKVEVYTVGALPQVDHEFEGLRSPERKKSFKPDLRPAPNQALLVVRVMFGKDAVVPKDRFLRFSPGSVRLVARSGAGGGGADGEPQLVNYHPIGTIDAARRLVANELDDFLVTEVAGDRGVDFAFLVDDAALAGARHMAPRRRPTPRPPPPPPRCAPTLAEGTFFEFNRMAREDLSLKPVLPASAYKANEAVSVMRGDTPRPKSASRRYDRRRARIARHARHPRRAPAPRKACCGRAHRQLGRRARGAGRCS